VGKRRGLCPPADKRALPKLRFDIAKGLFWQYGKINNLDMKNIFLFFLGVLLTASGCANGFDTHYEGLAASLIQTDPRNLKCAAPLLLQLPDKSCAEIKDELYAEGSWPVGVSRFRGESFWEDADDALAKGKELGACLVLYRQS
jgi:hypothetical protein